MELSIINNNGGDDGSSSDSALEENNRISIVDSTMTAMTDVSLTENNDSSGRENSMTAMTNVATTTTVVVGHWRLKAAFLMMLSVAVAFVAAYGSRLIHAAIESREPDIPEVDVRLLGKIMSRKNGLVFSDNGGQDCACSAEWDSQAQWGKLIDGENDGLFLMLMTAHLFVWMQSWGVLGTVVLIRAALLEVGLIFTGTWGTHMRHHTDAPPRYSVTLRDTLYAVMGGIVAHYLSHVMRISPLAVTDPISFEQTRTSSSSSPGGLPVFNKHSAQRAILAGAQIAIAWTCLNTSASSTCNSNRTSGPNYCNLVTTAAYVAQMWIFFLVNMRLHRQTTRHLVAWNIVWMLLVVICGGLWAVYPQWGGLLNVYAAWSTCIASICVLHTCLGLDLWNCATWLFDTEPDELNPDTIHVNSILNAYHVLCMRTGANLTQCVPIDDVVDEVRRQKRIRVSKLMSPSRRGFARYDRTYRTDLRRTACKFALGMSIFMLSVAGPSLARSWKDGFYKGVDGNNDSNSSSSSFMFSIGWCGNPVTHSSSRPFDSGIVSNACI